MGSPDVRPPESPDPRPNGQDRSASSNASPRREEVPAEVVPAIKSLAAASYDDKENARAREQIEQDRQEQEVRKEGHRRHADLHDYAADPMAPHQPHERIASVSRWTAPATFISGLAIAILLTTGAVESGWMLSTGWTIVLVLTGHLLLKWGLVSIPEKTFMDRFVWFAWPGVIAILGFASILILERVASAEQAAALLPYDGWAWLGLEVSLIFGAALSHTAYACFGESGRRCRRYGVLATRISFLSRKIRERGGVITVLLLALLFSVSPAIAESFPPSAMSTVRVCAPGIFVDRTRSGSAESQWERQLVEFLTRYGGKLDRLDVILFGERVSDAPAVRVILPPARRVASPFKPVIETAMRQAEEGRLAKLLEVFAQRMDPARYTNLHAVFSRAGKHAEVYGGAFVLTDGKEEPMRKPVVTSTEKVFVALTLAKGDPPEDAEVLDQREQHIKGYLPNAVVTRAFVMEPTVMEFVESVLGRCGGGSGDVLQTGYGR